MPTHANGTVTVEGSIVRNFATPISRHGEAATPGYDQGVANVGIAYSAHDQTAPVSQAGPGAVTSDANLGAIDPRFAGPDDFHLLGDSVDRAPPRLSKLSLRHGARSVAFSGRIGHHRLRAHRYRATLVATDAAGNHSTAHHLAFRIVRR